MIDSVGRSIKYLRLSITPTCALRCIYCRPPGDDPAHCADIMSANEIEQLVRHLVENHGLTKVRLTGGAPTARRDLIDIVRRLSRIDGLGELAMTTNGIGLAKRASALTDAGLTRVNISIDTLDQDTFKKMTGTTGLNKVLAGIEAADHAGLTPVKLNTVVVRGVNDHQLDKLVEFAAQRAFEIRFIELMPMGPLADAWAKRYVPGHEMRENLSPIVEQWTELSVDAAPAKRYRLKLKNGLQVTVGFISAMSCPFCDMCNRIRIDSNGAFYPCLMDVPAGSVAAGLRPRFDASLIDAVLQTGLNHKAETHPSTGATKMVQIGG